jgi:4'-phosphopantetheinyl transferase EntD
MMAQRVRERVNVRNEGLDIMVAWLEANAPTETASTAGWIENVKPYHSLEASVTKGAVKARRDEFHTGRRLARAALARLGCAPTVIPIGVGRAPIWPSGFRGSISHSRGVCIAHVGRARELLGVGVDIELDTPLPNELTALICRPDEDLDCAPRSTLSRFVAKEAFFKAYFPETRAFLDFHDVHVELEEECGTFVATLVGVDKPPLAGRRIFSGHCASVAEHIIAVLWVRS